MKRMTYQEWVGKSEKLCDEKALTNKCKELECCMCEYSILNRPKEYFNYQESIILELEKQLEELKTR